MNQPFDCATLEAEMQAAGIAAHRDWTSDGIPTTQDRPLTPAEQATAQAVLAAHDPGKRERDRAAEDADRRDVLRQLSDAHRDFDTLGTAARWAAVKLLIRVVLALARRLLP